MTRPKKDKNITSEDFINNFNNFTKTFPDKKSTVIHPNLPHNLIELSSEFLHDLQYNREDLKKMADIINRENKK